jgi:hypothetical protein
MGHTIHAEEKMRLRVFEHSFQNQGSLEETER